MDLSAARLSPPRFASGFTFVMATGIVSIGARVPGVPGVDAVRFALNIGVLVALLSVHSSGSGSPPGS